MFVTLGLKLASWLAGTGLTTIMSGVTDAYKAKLQAGNDQDKLAADLAARELAIQAQDADIQGRLALADGAGPRKLIGYSVGIYIAKLLVWDKTLGLGSTDDVSDRLFWIITTVIVAYFGNGAIRDVVSAFRARK